MDVLDLLTLGAALCLPVCAETGPKAMKKLITSGWQVTLFDRHLCPREKPI